MTNYSPRFSLTGMTGTFPPNVLAEIKSLKGTAGPATENNVVDPGSGADDPQTDGKFAIPFASQSGPIMYAPMQGRPGTKITAKNASPRYPTSSVQIAATFLPPPKQTTTFTMSLTVSASSHENTVSDPSIQSIWGELTSHQASPAPNPRDPMQKYLARWRD